MNRRTEGWMDGWMSFTSWAHHLACWAGTLVGAQCLVAFVGTTFFVMGLE